jgi:UDP-N-acetylglucosamine:LPS N-acetylglucosamine transferase
MAPPFEMKRNKLLLITSSGGGGHIQAAKAQAVKALAENPNTEIIQKDILIDMASKRFGKGFVYLWNSSQKRGNVKFLMFLQKNVPTADIVFGTFIFLRTLHVLLKEGIDQIIDTQPVGTFAIIKAIKLARKITGKPLKLEKIVTELPTDNVIHFFRPIKLLSETDRSFIKLISTIPLLKENQTAEGFWRKNCGLSESEVCYESFPLLPSFKQYLNKVKTRNERMKILIHVNSNEEKFLISDSIKRGFLTSEIYRDKIAINIEADDKVSTILLGSQPTEEATLKYLRNYIDLTKQTAAGENHLLFVFCNSHTRHKNSLLKKVYHLIQKIDEFPQNLTVIPMCFQNDDVISSLYYRSDATFTRSGGLTAMELMSVAQGQIWIHSEVRHGTADSEELGKGMPIWERGNATYLQHKKGARFITPETFIESCHSYFLPAHSKASIG